MNEKAPDRQAEEKNMVKLYTDLTGATEANARCVYMYLSQDSKEKNEDSEAKLPTGPDLGIKIQEKS